MTLDNGIEILTGTHLNAASYELSGLSGYGGSWMPLTEPMSLGRTQAAVAITGSGVLYVAGGAIDGGAQNTDSLEIWTLTEGWLAGPPLPVALRAPMAGVIDAGLFVAGGDVGGTPQKTLYAIVCALGLD